MNTPKHDAAFTLIELLTAIATVAILAGILISVLPQTREAAGQASCASNLRQIGIATQLYSNENEGNFPFHGSWPNYWMSSLQPYLENRDNPRNLQAVSVQRNYAGTFRCPGKTDYDLTRSGGSLGNDFFRISYRMQNWGDMKVYDVPTDSSRTLLVTDGSRSLLVDNPSQMYGNTPDTHALRHNGRDNVLFLDGNVEAIEKNGIIRDQDSRLLIRR